MSFICEGPIWSADETDYLRMADHSLGTAGTMVFTERYAPVGNIGEFGFRIARDLAATIT
jgi:hypothetical protein